MKVVRSAAILSSSSINFIFGPAWEPLLFYIVTLTAHTQLPLSLYIFALHKKAAAAERQRDGGGSCALYILLCTLALSGHTRRYIYVRFYSLIYCMYTASAPSALVQLAAMVSSSHSSQWHLIFGEQLCKRYTFKAS